MRLILVTALALIAAQAFAANGTMKGDGSAEKPFQIEDYEDLKAIGKGDYLYSSNYIVTKDIDASASEHEYCNGHVCNSFIAIGQVQNSTAVIPFSGSIDGQDHVIKNLRIWLPCLHYVGFIAQLEGSLSNLKFEHLRVYGGYDTDYAPHSDYVGGVVGLSKGQITNVHVKDGHVEGLRYVGGLVGQLETNKSFVSNSSFEGVVQGRRNVGGLIGTLEGHVQESFADVEIFVGINNESKNVGGLVGESNSRVHPSITKSYAMGIIVPEVEKAASNIGGLVGLNEDGFVELSYASVDIMSFNQGYFSECIGGLVGLNKAKISEAYATGNVTGYETVGGLVGENSRGGQIEYSYATGSVKVLRNKYMEIGGFAGGNWGSIYGSYSVGKIELPDDRDTAYLYVSGFSEGDSVNSCYWNVDLAGIDTSKVGIGLSDSAMKHLSSFAGWENMSKCNFKIEYEGTVFDIYETCDFYELGTRDTLGIWNIDEGESYPYLANLGKNAKATANIIAIAVPTKAAKWQEKPIVAAEKDVGYELFGKWLELVRLNEAKDSIYYSYRIGYANESDTVWGTISYMAVPNHIEIATFDDLKKIGNSISHPLLANYELVEDIDASSSNFTPIGEERKPFTGIFEGNNHVIEGLTVDTQNQFYAGLFGFASQSSIKNIVFKNAKVSGGEYAGVLGGQIEKSFISNVVSYDGDVKGDDQVGGLIGAAYKDSILKVGSTGTVKGSRNVGGLIGCFASYLKDGYAVSVVKGHEDVGGAIGGSNARLLIGDTVYNVYSASILKGPKDNLNGVIGDHINNSEGIFENFYYDGGLTQIVHAYNRNVTEGTVLSSELMLHQASFENFDFNGVWTIQEGKSYPYFKGMDAVLPGKLVDDGSVNVLLGEGTEESPYLISRYNDLKYIGKYEYKTDLYYKLTDNIYVWENEREDCNSDGTECKGFEPIPEFSGVFIGDNKMITGLYINRPDEDSVGLFRSLSPTAKVTGLMLDSLVIKGKNYAGGLAGVDKGASIERVWIFNSTIQGNSYVGMLSGSKKGGFASQVIADGNAIGEKYVGAVAGESQKASYMNDIAMATVTGESYVGGFSGIDSASTYKNLYAISHVQGNSKTGNLVGSSSGSTFTSVYYDKEVWQYNQSSVGKALTTAEMLDVSSYKDWDFENVWTKKDADYYPRLIWAGTDVRPVRDGERELKYEMKGSGTEKDPFLVKTYDDLKVIGYGKYKMSAIYSLANDIDASASLNEEYYIHYADGSSRCSVWHGFATIGTYRDNCRKLFGALYDRDGESTFTGVFHGNGYSIKNLHMGNVGLFRTIGEEAKVDSLSIVLTDSSRVFGILAQKNYGLVDAVHVKGPIERAGLVFENNGTIVNSSTTVVKGSISGAALVYENNGVIENCHTTGAFIFHGGRRSGLVDTNKGTIIKSFAMIDSTDALVYENYGTIDRAYIIGHENDVFVNQNNKSIENCYAIGLQYFVYTNRPENEKDGIKNSFIASNSCQFNYHALNDSKTFENVFFETSSKFCYIEDEKYYGQALDSIGIRTKNNFTGFDFESIWDIKEGVTYPMLRGLPNVFYAGKVDLKYDADKFKVGAVRADLQKKAIVFDPSYTLVVKFDSTSEKRLDSLEKAGAFALGNFNIDYRVGIVFVGDTIWSDAAQTKLTLNGSVKMIAQKSRGRFNVALNGNLVSLRYELPKSGNVKFSLVDMQGRVVKTADLGQRAAGAYSESIDVAKLGRGRYVGILQVGGKAVEKVVLLKR